MSLYVAPGFFSLIFSSPFPFNLSEFLYTSHSSGKLNFVFLFIQSENLCFLIGIFNLFSFHMVTDAFWFKLTMLLFVFYLSYVFSVFLSFLFSYYFIFPLCQLVSYISFYHSFRGDPRYFNVHSYYCEYKGHFHMVHFYHLPENARTLKHLIFISPLAFVFILFH